MLNSLESGRKKGSSSLSSWCRMWWWYPFGISVREHCCGYLTWLLKGECLSCLVRLPVHRGERCPGDAQVLWWDRKPLRTWTDTALPGPCSKCGLCSFSSVVPRLGCSWCGCLCTVLPWSSSSGVNLHLRAFVHAHTHICV